MNFVSVETEEDVRRCALEQSSGACSISVVLRNGARIDVSGSMSAAIVGDIIRAAAL